MSSLAWDHLAPFWLTLQEPVFLGGGARRMALGQNTGSVEGALLGWGKGRLSPSTKGPCVSRRHLERRGAGLLGMLGAQRVVAPGLP